ncbi:HlyD family type I secretion periplasmic adaptor subunit [Qipengyuania oceanensis]|uniref:Membrane fusion protein (MFP) family protein n=1 Tax=Qipengyuania oceanensis TaxID=1463597 RepID=A0A844YGV0_9SPHN|nr:HlyD family type I secretion periplasmic adaptor subunit [Qipengyuania oceanensis]MXO62244.1 HlyD family type I secretion periplasmic adaptor subunit [Qipengyuania oceanensis]
MTWRERFDSWDASRRLIAVSALGLFVLIVWAALAPVDEVTRGMGKVIPSSKAQLVQPAEPATIREILVRAGQSVRKGQLLVRLDDAQSSSELGQLRTETERLQARSQRLTTEAGGGPVGCAEGSLCAEEQRLAQVRKATARSREASLASAVEQRRRDLSEGQATVSSLESSLRLSREQVDMLRPLAQQGIVPQTELLTAQREMVDIQGRLSGARQGVARAAAAVRQAQSDLQSARLEFRETALSERSEVNTRIAVNQETLRGAEARQQRQELRAPSAGIVNDVQITTVGGFVGAGEKIMQIVPVGDKLLVEARVSPSDIAFIKVGDPANVKVTAYDFSVFGGLKGRVQNVSADSIYDEVEREAYYLVLVETDKAYIERDGKRLPIVPGMVCDVEIITGRKSVLSYLLKPVAKAFDEALTER